MHVLLVDECEPERDALALSLQTTSHRVDGVADAAAALVAHARDPAETVVFVGPTASALELLRKIRAVRDRQRAYVIVVLDQVMPGEIDALYDAGVDDFLRKPIAPEELRARVEAPHRIRQYAAALLKTAVHDWSSSLDLRGLRSFNDTASIVANDLAQIVGERLSVAPNIGAAAPGSSALRCASIPMSLATDGLELHISVIADETALRALGKSVMGDDLDEAGQRDLLRELANTAGGALKRAYATDNVALTTGLPVDASVPVPSEATRCWIAQAKLADATISFVCELRQTKSERVPATSLREGMVVSRDLRSESGALLVAAGTRLTATSAERVASALGDRSFVDVLGIGAPRVTAA